MRKSPWQIVGGASPTAVADHVLERGLDPLAERDRAVGQRVADPLDEQRPGVAVLLAGGEVDRVVEARHPRERRRAPATPTRSACSTASDTSASRGPIGARRRRPG